MNRKRVKDVDIFQRTLCCQPLREKEKEIEIFESETTEFEEKEEEEEAVNEVGETSYDMQVLMQELECMKRRIQMIQLRLKLFNEECPEEECLDYEVLLNCSQNKEICALQKRQNMLQCQNNELIKCLKAAKEQIQDLHFSMCEKTKKILELREFFKTLTDWKNNLKQEFGKCLERFEYLKHVKAEWNDVNEKIGSQQKFYESLKASFVPQVCFLQEKQAFICAIKEIKEMLKELFQYQFEHLADLEKRLKKKD